VREIVDHPGIAGHRYIAACRRRARIWHDLHQPHFTLASEMPHDGSRKSEYEK